ncbi:MAG: ribosome biogenesis GTPase Der [Nitriliruptoraceae bacterium]
MNTPGMVIAIDGPAGSGKSTVAGAVAARLGVAHIDTGALYRAAALACINAGVDLDDEAACSEIVVASSIERDDGVTLLDGDDVEDEIRGELVTAAVSRVAAHAGVRDALGPIQRQAAVVAGGVVEGRDIGTVVLPDAHLKVFLTASVHARAQRRAEQVGSDDIDGFAATISARDQADGERAVAPLAKANDAWELDTTDLSVDEVVEAIVTRAQQRYAETLGDPVAAHRRLPRVAVVGRPNVGKSTLVNRILGRRVAIVEERPGVTRDRVEHLAQWADRDFIVIDTGGWEADATGLDQQVVAQAQMAIQQADLVLFVVDATVGALEDDERYARLLRRAGVPTMLVANKVDAPRHEPLIHELHNLGLGTPTPISARHNRGVGELFDDVATRLPQGRATTSDHAQVGRIAIVGRPNVGKSSLLNRLVGEQRVLVDAVPHTTRDAVHTMMELDGTPWMIVDTAGIRRHYRRGENTELYAVDRTNDAIDQADVVLFIVDASEPLGEQDQRIAARLREAGRAIVMVCNKWDLVDDERRSDFTKELDRLLSFADWAPRLNVSAQTGRGIRRLASQLDYVWGNYQRRIPTRELNQVTADAVAAHALPRDGNKQLKIRYVTQAESSPPRFVLFANGTIPSSYVRYLERILRQTYDFSGVPLLFEGRVAGMRRKRERDAARR